MSETIYNVDRPLKRPPTHPGEILREDVLPALRLSVSDAARRLGTTRQTLHRILAETHPVTPEMALRLGKLCGNGPGLWLRLQGGVDLYEAEHRISKDLKKIVTVETEPTAE